MPDLYGGGQEEDLLAYPLLKGSDEFGTRARYSTTSTRGRHRTGLHVRPDRPGLHHGLRGLGVYQFCPQRDLRSWRLCRRGGPPAAGKRRPFGNASHRFRLAARDSQRHAAQRSGGRGVRASGLSSAPGKPTTRCVDLRYRRFIFSAGRSPFFRKSLAEYFLPHLSHTGRPRSDRAAGAQCGGAGEIVAGDCDRVGDAWQRSIFLSIGRDWARRFAPWLRIRILRP